MPPPSERLRRRAVTSPVGALSVTEADGAIVALDWSDADDGEASPVLVAACRQLEAYFAGRLENFEIPLAPVGSAFERRVWDALVAIPFGETKTYGDIARTLGAAPRAVGHACATNPIPILIPCHRVVGANGRLTGYSGQGGIATKQRLLEHEGLFGPRAMAR